MEALATKYRPRSFADLAGQQAVQVILQTMVATRQIPQALLFDGSRGTGKTTTARIVAASLNCSDTPVPCGHCVACKSTFDGTSLDVLEIDAASNGLVDNIRDLRHQVLYATGGGHRVVILDEAHSMSAAAFNALLKTLEEPPPGVVFILCTTEPRKIPETIASRCIPFTFRRLTVADITARLTHIAAREHITADTDLLEHLAVRADGAMRDAVMLLDQVARAGITSAARYHDLTGDADPGLGLLAAIATGNPATAFARLHVERTSTGNPDDIVTGLIGVLRDLLVLGAGGTLPPGPGRAERATLAQAISAPVVINCLRLLWDVQTKARLGESGLDIAVALATTLFTATAPAAAPGPLNLAQMRTSSDR